jgi:hypothetical protein
MSFSICYYSKTIWPYEDWISHGSPPDVIFQYSEHGMNEHMYLYFFPFEKIVYIDIDMDYYDINVIYELNISNNNIGINRLLCKSQNHWDELNGDAPKSGEGGINWLKRNMKVISPDFLSMNFIANKFFSPSWNVEELPLTRPRASEKAILLSKNCYKRMGSYKYGPWDKIIGTYFKDRITAAIIIQKYYRGWQVRMKITFNPHNSYGKYKILCGLKEISLIIM